MSNGTHIGHRIARVDTLRPHPRNSEIYGDPRDSQDFTFFVQDCRENGIHPLVIAEDGTIIGGHRRYYAALQLGIEELPVAVYRYATPVDMLAALVADNNARIKSNWQLSSEAAVLMEVERERAKQRQAVGHYNGPQYAESPVPELVPELEQKSDARDAVGAALGVSGKQVDNFLTVKRAVDTLRDAGDDEAADELITLVNRSAKAAAQQARSQMAQPTEERTKPHVAHNSGNNEWYTPAEYVEAARQVLEIIDLDPASSAQANEIIKAARFFIAEDDGLAQPWAGRVWMNPPYTAGLVEQFAEKLTKHYKASEVEQAIVLVNNATETAWFQRMAQTATAICFPKGRVRFWQPDGPLGAPLQGQAIIYMGQDIEGFVHAFGGFGLVVTV